MWRNYVTVGLRALAKNKIYAFINIFGLAVGLAACLLILLYVNYEESYDDWLPNADQVYQLQTFYSANSKLGEQKFLQLSAIVAGKTLPNELAGIPSFEGELAATDPLFDAMASAPSISVKVAKSARDIPLKTMGSKAAAFSKACRKS